tara:strand:- start:20 stop:811 length:792 start_codon:yes stop_codon:yes gene_type:complete
MPATFFIIGKDGNKRKILDVNALSYSSSGGGVDVGLQYNLRDRYYSFILTSVQKKDAEKIQLLQTFGESLVYFHGRNPVNIGLSFVLPNSTGLPLAALMQENYDRYFRGSALVKRGGVAVLSWADNVIVGYPLSFETSEVADDTTHLVKGSMDFMLTEFHTMVSATAPPLGDETGTKIPDRTQRILAKAEAQSKTQLAENKDLRKAIKKGQEDAAYAAKGDLERQQGREVTMAEVAKRNPGLFEPPSEPALAQAQKVRKTTPA